MYYTSYHGVNKNEDENEPSTTHPPLGWANWVSDEVETIKQLIRSDIEQR